MKYLETFIKVCELGSYTAAAEAMKISQPGVSKQIGRLQAPSALLCYGGKTMGSS